MRSYSLINANGDIYDITAEDVVLHSTSGLGYESDDYCRKIGDRWIQVSKEKRQNPISGTLTFFGEKPYEQYNKFVQFVQFSPLRLSYTPDYDTFYKTVFISRLDKGERDKTGALNVGIDLMPLTPWYKIQNAISETIDSSHKGFVWPVTWPVTWRMNKENQIEMQSDSIMESPCKIVIEGPILNPRWDHYVNGVHKTSGGITRNVIKGNRLVIDTTVIPSRLVIEDSQGNLVEDVYQRSDFSTNRFIFLGYGTNSVRISNENQQKVNITMEAQILYDTV